MTVSGCGPKCKILDDKEERKYTKKTRHQYRTIQFTIPPKKNPTPTETIHEHSHSPQASPRESSFRAARQTEKIKRSWSTSSPQQAA